MQHYNVGRTSLATDGSTKPVEMYIPLWFGDGASASTTNVGVGSAFILDSSTTTGAVSNSTAKFYTQSSQWSASTKFALEVTMNVNNAAGVASAQLWDVTAGAVVAGSLITTTSTTFIVVRSAQFSLISGRQYAVTIGQNATYTVFLTDASLIVFP